MRTAAELVLGRDPDTVPRARRFIRSSLAGESPTLEAEAELIVAELVTNAVLYGEPPIRVRLYLGDPSEDGNPFRVEVEDAGRTLPILLGQNLEAMTGRGLALVSAVASSWGVEPTPLLTHGKTVWAELVVAMPADPNTDANTDPNCDLAAEPNADSRHTDLPHPLAPPSRPDIRTASAEVEALLAAWSDRHPAEPTFRVELGEVSTELLVAAKAHIDNVVREFTLLREGEASSGVALPEQLAALVQTVTVDFAEARAEIKRQAAAAAARGDSTTDLVLELPASAADAGERYLEALDQADRYARSAHLLTEASPPEYRLFRRWYVQSLVDQLRALSHHQQAPPPRPLYSVLAAEVDRLSRLEHVSARLELLQKVNGELVDARTPHQMAEVVVDNAIQYLGVESARVRFPTDRRTLRSVAWRTRDGTPEPEATLELPIDSELPAARAIREHQPIFLRSINQALGPYPELAGFYPQERSGHVIPLLVGDETLGVLTLTFDGGELSDEAEDDFVRSLADALAQALRRANLSASDLEKQETLSFLADATEIMVSAQEPSEVLEQLVQHAVPRLGDWCTVYLADGNALRRVAMAISGFPDVAERLKTTSQLSLDVDVPQTQAYRSKRMTLIPNGVGRLLTRLYPDLDFAGMGGDLDGGTGLCAPIILRDQRIGVLAITFLGSGRQVTAGVVDALSGLAARAAIALDNAQRWSEQNQAVQALVSALLPSQPPDIPGVQFAARYVPAAGDVAGDWWEASPMPDGTILVGLGDAAGHGLDAVSEMCELRHGARALAAIESSPAALLADLNRRLAETDSSFATAVFGRFDPETYVWTWASAGHVPPIHVDPKGNVSVLHYQGTVPLGCPQVSVGSDESLKLEPGATLVLYSDGLIERRHEGLDKGIARLVDTVAEHYDEDLERLADAIIEGIGPFQVDDCCLLLLRRTPAPAPTTP